MLTIEKMRGRSERSRARREKRPLWLARDGEYTAVGESESEAKSMVRLLKVSTQTRIEMDKIPSYIRAEASPVVMAIARGSW